MSLRLNIYEKVVKSIITILFMTHLKKKKKKKTKKITATTATSNSSPVGVDYYVGYLRNMMSLRHELKVMNVFLYGYVPIDVKHGTEDIFGL